MPGDLVGSANVRFSPAEARRNEDDAHMLDGREGEHPLEVANIDQQQGGNTDGHQAEADKPGSRIEARRAANHGKEPKNHIKRRGRFDAGQQSANGGRRLAMGVRQPGVHRHEVPPWCQIPQG